MNKIHGQDSFSGKYQFAQHAFGAEYPRDNFKKFKGKIKIVNQSTMIFGDKVLEIFNTDQKLKLIFSKGIFYPNIFTSKKTTKAKSVKELKSMTTYEKLIYNSNRNDSISISDFQELEKLNPNPQTKRFVFWLYQKNSMNPTECYIELININANENTPIEEFIEESKLVLFRRGTIII